MDTHFTFEAHRCQDQLDFSFFFFFYNSEHAAIMETFPMTVVLSEETLTRNTSYRLQLSQTLLKYKGNMRSGGELLLEDVPESSSNPRLLKPCREENTLMCKQIFILKN